MISGGVWTVDLPNMKKKWTPCYPQKKLIQSTPVEPIYIFVLSCLPRLGYPVASNFLVSTPELFIIVHSHTCVISFLTWSSD
jgi:hypothetical protein